MGLLRGTALVILGALLLVTVLGANLLVGVDRTVMDSGFMTTAMAEEDVYPAIAAGMNSSNRTGAASIVDAGLLRNQTEAAVPAFYEFLHGEREHLVVPVMTGELQDRLTTVMTQQVRSSGLEQVSPRLARLAEGQEQYQAARQQFRQAQYERFQARTDDQLDRDELRMMFDAHRPEIRSRILQNKSSMEGVPGNIASELRILLADGLVNETMTYQQFSQQLNALIGKSIPENRTAAMDIPDELNLSARMDRSQQRQVEAAQQVIQGLDTASLGLPVVAALIGGLVWLAASTGAGAVLVIGAVVALAGLISTGGLVAARTLGSGALEQAMTAQFPAEIGQAFTGVAMQVLDAFLAQSVLVLVLGIGLIGTGIYLRRSAGGDE